MTPEEIDHLAKLARMELTESEKASLVGDMHNILGFIDAIKEADVEMNADARTGAVSNVFRDDDPPAGGPHEGGIHTDALLAAAPVSESGFLKVKKIL